MWAHHTSSARRWSQASLHVSKHVTRYRIVNIYLNSTAQTFAIEVELEFINGLGEVKNSHYISEIIKEDIVCDIEDEVMKYMTGKSDDCEDKPTYKKPGVIYQHVSTAKPGSTETQKAIERILKNSFYGMNAISPLDGKPYIGNEKYLASTIEGAIRKKLIDENDISVGDFKGAKDAFSFEYYGAKFKAYIKSIAYVTAEGQSGATWKLIKLNDLIVSTDDNQGTELDIRIDSVACYGSHFDLRRGGLTDAITGVHVSRVEREWFDYLNRKHMKRLGKAAVHHLEPITPATSQLPWLSCNCDLTKRDVWTDNYLNEKENKEMKENENKIIINHNAVIVYIGKQKAVVSVINKKTSK